MKNLASLFLLTFLSVMTNSSLAHSDHAHQTRMINAAQAKSAALDATRILTETDKGLGFGKLPKTWSTISLNQTKVEKQMPDYFIVSVTNDTEKKILFILISAYGEAYDANFSGTFKGLDSSK